jgi:peroxiredoxin
MSNVNKAVEKKSDILDKSVESYASSPNLSQEIIMKDEPTYQGLSAVPQPGDKAFDFDFELTSGQKVSLTDLNSRSPVLLNFIKGTWCPFCQRHLYNLRSWQNKFSYRNITLLVISNEPTEALRAWARDNEIKYLFGSIKDTLVFSKYGVDIANHDFARPATFLIEKGMVIRFSYTGVREESALFPKVP